MAHLQQTLDLLEEFGDGGIDQWGLANEFDAIPSLLETAALEKDEEFIQHVAPAIQAIQTLHDVVEYLIKRTEPIREAAEEKEDLEIRDKINKLKAVLPEKTEFQIEAFLRN